ncbi:MAG: histidine kinase [Flavobacteriales bacterium]|nr:histidine kinase [Flavobacteriales bacterium]
MRRLWPALLLVLLVPPCAAQYPHTQVQEIRVGQRRTAITLLAQDKYGLIWAASDLGVLRLDGDRVDVMASSGGATIMAMAQRDNGMAVALSSGVVLHCAGTRVDTIYSDRVLVRCPVRAMVVATNGTVHLGTYGAGILSIERQRSHVLSTPQGLPDSHVNDLCLLQNGSLVAATDQGLALVRDRQVREVFGQRQAAPDNLVLSVAEAPGGGVWAGTDNGGAFLWTPGRKDITDAWSAEACGGAVRSIACQGALLWTAGSRPGATYFDRSLSRNGFAPSEKLLPGALPAMDLLCDPEGALWWCDGTGRLYRADPAVFFIPELAGMDISGINALRVTNDRSWFATVEGLFSCALGELASPLLEHATVPVDPQTPIVSLDLAPDGTIWAATFGNGLFAVRPNGHVDHFSSGNGGIDPNVLCVRTRGEEVWLATLSGMCRLVDGEATCFTPSGSGFMYMLLPLEDGTVLGATDGNGVVRFDRDRLEPVDRFGPRTYYALSRDAAGSTWAVGPESGLCRLKQDTLICTDGTMPQFQGDLFAVACTGRHVLVFSDGAAMAYDTSTGLWSDITAQAGLSGLQAELNAAGTGPDGSIWLACDKGLVRLRAPATWFSPHLNTVITEVVVDHVHLAAEQNWETPHDRNAVTFRFAAPHYADPGAVRFELRLLGLSDKIIRTREREASYPALPPGTYTFEVRAFVGEEPRGAEWARQHFVIVPPWWRLWWVAPAAVLALVLVITLWFRARERRLRYRQKLEQDQVRFQLEALRSQVDPHFLFNSFNTLVELIESQPSKAVEQVEELSTFFRNILHVRDKPTISLGEELSLVSTYFRLEQRRFGQAIAMETAIGAEDRRLHVVPLTLQLLVENAIKHNVADMESPLLVNVRVEDGLLVVCNRMRPRSSPVRSTSFGLDSIRKRYAALSPIPVSARAVDGRFIVQIPLIQP